MDQQGHNLGNRIKFKTEILRLSHCDYIDANIKVKENIRQ